MRAAFYLMALAIAGCSRSGSPTEVHDPQFKFFGVASLKEDKTICLHMRSEEPPHPVAETYSCYGPDHPDYAMIMKHVGPVTVGKEKVFGPFE